MMNDRKQTDLEESKYAKAPARLQQDGIHNLYINYSKCKTSASHPRVKPCER
jgi:hypothetical protein